MLALPTDMWNFIARPLFNGNTPVKAVHFIKTKKSNRT
jgi:hypothetical protein